MSRRSSLQILLCTFPLIALLLLLHNLCQYAFVAPVSFDGAMNLNTAASLASGSGYGFFYDTFFPFPAQTDGPFVLPAALLIRVFGVSPLVTQAVNLLYICLLIPLLTVLLMRVSLPLWAALTGTLIAISVPGFSEYGMNGYGEIPALGWYIASLLAMETVFRNAPSRSGALIAGVFLALAYLTKVVALVFVGSFFAIALVFTLRRHLAPRAFLLLLAGFLIPIFLWESYRFVSIGSLEGYARWWILQLGQILHQSGAKYSIAGTFGKAAQHFSTLGSITGLSSYILTAFLLLPVVLWLFVRTRCTAAERFIFLCLLLSGFLYFSWWLLLTPTSMAWLRRILDGIVIHQVLLFSFGFRAVSTINMPTTSTWLRKASMIMLSTAVIFPIFVLFKNGQNVAKPVEVPAYTESFFKLASLVRQLPADAVIFGTGWWQSPGIALYSGRRFSNFQHWTPDAINDLKAKYFVFDTYTTGLARSDIINARALCDTEELYKGSGGELYRIERAKHYAPIALSLSDLPKLKNKMDFSEGDYEFKRGFYQVEDAKYAWMRPDGLVILARTAEPRLVVSLVVPAQLNKDSPVNLRVTVPECATKTFSLSKPWDNSVELNLDCPPSSEQKPIYAYLQVDKHMPFVNQIDADNRLLSVLVRSVALAN
jgi:hypothetical protein